MMKLTSALDSVFSVDWKEYRKIQLQDPESSHHGKLTSYQVGCRCDKCVDAHRTWQQDYRAQKQQEAIPDEAHGTLQGYQNYGCRCGRCTQAVTDYYQGRPRIPRPRKPIE